MGISEKTFRDPRQIAILPMGFCYPGTGPSGDLPPRPECAQVWRPDLLAMLKNVTLTLVIGQYAMAYHLPDETGSLTEVVERWRNHESGLVPLPHPSPRNNIWLKRNPWFERDRIPALRERVREALGSAR